MDRVIITGVTGFLGEWFLKALLKKGIEVYAIARDSSKIEAGVRNNPNLHIVELDLANIMWLSDRVDGAFDAFYHFAWGGTAGDERTDYNLQIQNIMATCDAVRVAGKLGCAKFINAGSLMEFEAIKWMGTGKMPVGNYIYRSAKLAAHYMAKAEAGRVGIPFINMIISNIYGVGEDSERFICTTLKKIIRNEQCRFTSGTQIYDFINIKDAVEAFYAVGEYGKPYKDYYIGSNQIRPLREYIEELFASVPTADYPEFGVVPYDGISLKYDEFDRNGLLEDAGFQCKISFADGIRETYEWMVGKNGIGMGSAGI